MSKSTKASKGEQPNIELAIQNINVRDMDVAVIGNTPLIMNRMSEKVRQELLLPGRKKTNADKKSTAALKHDPYGEYQSGFYRSKDESALTAFHLPGGSFTKSMGTAALDIPGATKAQIQRYIRVKDLSVQVYGVPQIFMATVRTMGINRTPDIRTRPIFPEWAAVFSISYVSDFVTPNTIGTLLSSAGFLSGVGDWRSEKGGPYGQFHMVTDSDEDEDALSRLKEEGGREAQEAAFDNPVPYDDETTELLSWFEGALVTR